MSKSRSSATILSFFIAIFAAITTYILVVRPRHLRWGATDEEMDRKLPGDELIPNPRLRATHAVSVETSPNKIWPWLVQLGQGRGGFYSYERLENLAGCQIHNADSILPEHQDLKVGDQVRIGPQGYPAFDVAGIEPNSWLILRGDIPPGVEPKTGIWVWSFFLAPGKDHTTRLILRTRLNYESGFGSTLMWRVFVDPISFNMEREMLKGIKRRVEYTHSK